MRYNVFNEIIINKKKFSVKKKSKQKSFLKNLFLIKAKIIKKLNFLERCCPVKHLNVDGNFDISVLVSVN